VHKALSDGVARESVKQAVEELRKALTPPYHLKDKPSKKPSPDKKKEEDLSVDKNGTIDLPTDNVFEEGAGFGNLLSGN